MYCLTDYQTVFVVGVVFSLTFMLLFLAFFSTSNLSNKHPNLKFAYSLILCFELLILKTEFLGAGVRGHYVTWRKSGDIDGHHMRGRFATEIYWVEVPGATNQPAGHCTALQNKSHCCSCRDVLPSRKASPKFTGLCVLTASSGSVVWRENVNPAW